MLLYSGTEVWDMQLQTLTEFLEFIDSKLLQIESEASESFDPDAMGLFDRGEYFIGIGFVAVQQHLNESLIEKYLKKNDAFSLGPVHSSNASSISIINAAANWWKHESEWQRLEQTPNNTYKTIMGISEQQDYALSNVLASFSDSDELSFTKSIIPCVEQWTKEIMEEAINRKK